MKEHIKSLTNHPLITGSIIIFLGTNVGNVFNLLFNFFMVRNLSEADFGILTSLNSLVVLPTLVASALVPIVVNFAAEYFAKGEIDHVHGFYLKMSKYVFIASSILLVGFVIFSSFLASFFHINNIGLIILSGFIVFGGLLLTVNTAFLQAKLSFLYLSISTFTSAAVRLILGIILVLLGWGVGGGIWAFFISTVYLFAITFYPVRSILKNRSLSSPIPQKELLSYGLPSAVSVIGLTAFITTDIFIIKHFFPPEIAGIYASLALIAKIIFFLTQTISLVMFPVVVQKRSRNEEYQSTFVLGLLLVAIPSILLTICYFLFPSFVSTLIVKKSSSVVEYSGVLGIFGIFFSIYSVVFLLNNFYLSIRRTKVAIPVIIAAIFQGVLLWIYAQNASSHQMTKQLAISSFTNMIEISAFLLLLLMLGLLLYYPHATKK